MAFLRRMRRNARPARPAEGTVAALARPVGPSPPELRAREGGAAESHSTLSSEPSTPQPAPQRRSKQHGVSASTVTATLPADSPPPQPGRNALPPGMPPMPDSPPAYVRQEEGERRVSSIDAGARRSGSAVSPGNSRRRLHLFGRRGSRARSSSASGRGDSSSASLRRRRRRAADASDDDSAGSELAHHARDSYVYSPAAYANTPVSYDAQCSVESERLQLSDLSTKGRYVRIAEEVCDPVRVHDSLVSFVVPHGWIATRTEWGFYLSSKKSLGFVLAAKAKDAAKLLVDTTRLSVFSEVRVMSSPVFESTHSAVVQYAAHDMSGRGVAQYDIGFVPGAVVFALCAPQPDSENLHKVEERLAASAVVLQVPVKTAEQCAPKSTLAHLYEPAAMLSTGTNCVMQ